MKKPLIFCFALSFILGIGLANSASAEAEVLKSKYVFDILPTDLPTAVEVNKDIAEYEVLKITVNESDVSRVTIKLKVLDTIKGNAAGEVEKTVWKPMFDRYPLVVGRKYILGFNDASSEGLCSYLLINYVEDENDNDKSVKYAKRLNYNDLTSPYKISTKFSTSIQEKVKRLNTEEKENKKVSVKDLKETLRSIANEE